MTINRSMSPRRRPPRRPGVLLPGNRGPAGQPRPRSGRHRRLPDQFKSSPRLSVLRRWSRSTPLAVLLVLLLVGGQVSQVLAATPLDRRCAEPVQLNVTVSAEKAAVLHKLVPSFIEQSFRWDGTHSCKMVNVEVTSVDRADKVIDAIGVGWSSPDNLPDVGPEAYVWLPDSSWEMAAAIKELERHRNSDVSLVNLGSVAVSPLVIAATKPAADELAGVRDWQAVLDIAKRRTPSGAPVVTFRRPSPPSSGLGMLATIALYSSQLGDPLDDKAIAAPDAALRLHDTERLVATTDDQSDPLLCSARERETALAVLASEKAAADYNEGAAAGQFCPREQRVAASLTLSYPEDGTPYLDHPFVAVKWNDRPVNERREQAVRDFFDFLVSREAQDELRRARFRDRDGYAATNQGGMPGRPDEQRFGAVEIDAVLRAFDNARKPARVTFLFDVSSAMAEPFRDRGGSRLRAGADAVIRAVRSIGGKDEVALWTAAARLDGEADHREVVPMGPADRVRPILDQLEGTGQPTRLNQALLAAVNAIGTGETAPADTRGAVVVIADGSGQEPDTEQLVDRLRAVGRPAPVFLIAFGASACEPGHWQEIATASGGACHPVSSAADIDIALGLVAASLWGGNHG